MEMESILGYLENKSILVTGATGFLGMVFVEKILRVQPDVKKLYLLLRASDTKSATDRMHNQMIGKELFGVLKEKWGNEFGSFIAQKVVVVPGDVVSEDLGVKEYNLREQMWNEINIILNSAGTTNFDERYDVALNVNTFGVEHVLNFAKKCVKLEMLLHVSTAFVCGEREGLIPEDSSFMDVMTKEITKFDFKVHEKKLVEKKLKGLKEKDATEEVITATMKDFGIERAKLYGWPNTYVFTKAMGEIILLKYSKNNLPIIIIRPAVITSTYKEPFPGWIQGFRTIDSVIAGYCKGKLKCLLVDPMSVFDMIPVDMVVNSILSAMVVNANNKSCFIIYQVGSSFRNPINFNEIHNFIFRHFTKNPWVDKDGKQVKVDKCTMFKTMPTFRTYMQLRFMLPLKGLKLVCKAFGHFEDIYVTSNQKLKLVMRLVELYKPYMLFKGVFDDKHTEELRRIARDSLIEAENFSFDPNNIVWEDYIMHTHIPGLLKHVMMKQ